MNNIKKVKKLLYKRSCEGGTMIISVVIPAFNVEGVVGNTVKSVPVDELEEMGFHVG